MTHVPTIHTQICIHAFEFKTDILCGCKCQIYLKICYTRDLMPLLDLEMFCLVSQAKVYTRLWQC